MFSHDPMGRVNWNDQCTPQNCGTGDFEMLYTYDFLGDITSSTDGQFDLFSDTYNRAAQLTSLVSSYADSNHPGTLFSSAVYNAPGQLTSDLLGNGITETRAYNPRLWMTSLAAGSAYNLNMTSYAPDGDVLASNDSANGNWTYTYDDFNRLIGANQNSGQAVYTYAYDRFGNRWQQNGPHTMMLTFSGANNRMDGYSYDADGNVLNDGTHSYTYDAENRIISVDGGSTATYIYDAEGRRAEKDTSSGWRDYIHDLSGRAVAEVTTTGWQRGEVFAGGRHIATYANGTTYFDHGDWLGTERVRTAVNGSVCESITSLPFGDGQSTTGSCADASTRHFTGKERDTESGLDNFGARYNSSSMGRFMSPDPDTATPLHIINPQRWNMYAYGMNNPLSYTDPTGRDAIAVNFVGEVPLVGHEGIIVVHSDGSATYARFGPVHSGDSSDKGKVTVDSLNQVKFGPNGLPTDASYKDLAAEVASIEKQPASAVGFNYFKTSDADTIALQNWIDNWKTANPPDYDVFSSNCASFCVAGLLVGHAIENKNISLIPNRLFILLSLVADENWTWQGRQDNREPKHKRHKVAPCLKHRNGGCVD